MYIEMARAIIITGGNIGDMKPRLRQAQQLINNEIGIVLRCSHTYTSPAWGFDGDDFTNQAMIVDTDLSPVELLAAVQDIELRLGRDRVTEAEHKHLSGDSYSPRIIDIDIIFYDDVRMHTHDLVIPHPLMHEREFVLEPLAEIAPTKVHPEFGVSVAELYRAVVEKREGADASGEKKCGE